METDMLNWVKSYLKNTDKGEQMKDWQEVKSLGFEGPKVEEMLSVWGCFYASIPCLTEYSPPPNYFTITQKINGSIFSGAISFL